MTGSRGRSSSFPAAALAIGCLGLLGCSGESPDVAATPEMVREQIDRGSYAGAEEQARGLLTRDEAKGGAESLDTEVALDLLVESLWRMGRARETETLELAERAVQTKEQRLGPSDPGLAVSLTNLGTVQRRNRDLETAEQTLGRALDLITEAEGPDDVRIAPILTQLGIIDLSMGDPDAAKHRLQRAVALLEQGRGPDDPGLADPLRALGVLQRRAGNFEEATTIYERLLDLERRHLVEDSPDHARSLNSYAALLQNIGDYSGARLHFEQALQIRRRTLEPDHLDIGASLNNVAIVLEDIGDHASANRYYDEALVILEKQLGTDHPYVASTMSNLASSLREVGEYDRARETFERALAIQEEQLDPDDPDLVQTLTNMAILFTETGEYASAMPLYERTLPILQAGLGREHLEVAECLNNLAGLLARTGESERAQETYREALAIREKTGGADHPLVAQTLTDSARASLDVGDSTAALELALRAHEISREHVRLTSETLSEREALSYGESRIPALEIALAVVARGDGPPGTARRVWDGVIRSRALVLDEMAFRNRDLGGADDPEIARRVEALKSARANLADLWVKGDPDLEPEEYRELLDEAHHEKEQAETALARASLDFRRQRDRADSGFDEVRAALPRDAALVAYVRAEDAYVAFVSGVSATAPVAITLGPATAIESAIESWRSELMRGAEASGRALREAETSYRRIAGDLRALVWDPVDGHLAGASRVFVVADGALNLVSFPALPVGDGYLIDQERTIHLLVTERDLLPSEIEVPAVGGLFALGGPAYDGGLGESGGAVKSSRGTRSACGVFGALEFTPLPEAEREVQAIAERWNRLEGVTGTARVLTRDEATEEAFKTLAPGNRVVHLATHGYFLGEACATASGGMDSPLLLSGLALAGANRRHEAQPGREDGILTAEEISAMDFGGTEWVVLSACDTGLGRILPGEDVFGLRRAFQIAGARRIVMSLWQVDDLASRRWMSAFYDAAFAAGSASPDNLASRKILDERRRNRRSTHPYFWGGFVASGL